MLASLGHRLAAPRGWRALVAAATLGALSAAALPPVHAIPVLLVAIPGLLILCGAQPGRRGAALTGFCFGLGHHVVGLYWITEAIMFEAARYWWLVPVAVPALAAVLALFIAVPCAVARSLPGGPARLAGFAGAWVLADLARQFVATGFPWNPLGSAWAIPGQAGDLMLQPAAWAGVHGLTFATVLLACLPLLGWRACGAGTACLVAWIGAGFWRLDAPPPLADPLTVVLVQGNVPQGQKWDRALLAVTFDRYLVLSRDAVSATTGAAAVVWPETASPYLLETDAVARSMIARATSRADGMQVPALVGSVRFDEAARPRNSLVALLGNGPPEAIYDKWHLVPFGEYQPEWLPLPIQIVPGGGFARGHGPVSVRVTGLPAFSPLICYEAIFPGSVIDAADRPSWLVNITNDAWFGNSTGPRQHLAAARLRAVEEGLPLVRAANTGISAAFDAYGRELGRIGMNRTGTLAVKLTGPLAPTLFARIGLALPLLLALLSLAVGLRLARRAGKLLPAILNKRDV